VSTALDARGLAPSKIVQNALSGDIMLKLKLAIGALLTLGAVGTASAALNCNTFPNNTVNTFVNDDVEAIGYACTIGASGSVNGNVLQSGLGSLVIRGKVNGGISEDGPGDVIVAAGANVGGDVSEADVGNVSIRGGGSIAGVIDESGDGSVSATVDLPGLVKGDIYENGNGGVTINATSGSYEGSVAETGSGSVTVNVNFGMSFKGNVEEYDGGNVTATVNGMFEGGIVENLGGNVSTAGAGIFKGNSEQQAPGTCTNTIVNFEGSACTQI
jgi:hypothetical protein